MTEVAQIYPLRNSLQSALDMDTLVDIRTDEETGDGEFTGFVIKLSNQFMMLLSVESWHYDGIQILPIKYITSVKAGDNNVDRGAILAWHNAKQHPDYHNINIDSYFDMFNTVKDTKQVVAIEDFESVEIGLVTKVSQQSLTLKGIDGSGVWLEEEVVRPFSNIWQVSFDDEYSRVLGSYAESNNTKSLNRKNPI